MLEHIIIMVLFLASVAYLTKSLWWKKSNGCKDGCAGCSTISFPEAKEK